MGVDLGKVIGSALIQSKFGQDLGACLGNMVLPHIVNFFQTFQTSKTSWSNSFTTFLKSSVSVEVGTTKASLLPTVLSKVFGIGTTKAQLLMTGCCRLPFELSTAPGSGLFGFSLATTVIGGSIILVTIVEIGCYLYTRINGQIVEAAQSNVPLSEQQLDQNYQGPSPPQWKPIDMSPNLFNQLKILSNASYQQRVTKFICPITMQVMREPSTVKCCKNLSQKPQHGEHVSLKDKVKKNGICPLCQSKAIQSDIELDEDLEEQIIGFRSRIYKTYKTSSNQLKQKWKMLIDKEFGEGYTQKFCE